MRLARLNLSTVENLARVYKKYVHQWIKTGLGKFYLRIAVPSSIPKMRLMNAPNMGPFLKLV